MKIFGRSAAVMTAAAMLLTGCGSKAKQEDSGFRKPDVSSSVSAPDENKKVEATINTGVYYMYHCITFEKGLELLRVEVVRDSSMYGFMLYDEGDNIVANGTIDFYEDKLQFHDHTGRSYYNMTWTYDGMNYTYEDNDLTCIIATSPDRVVVNSKLQNGNGSDAQFASIDYYKGLDLGENKCWAVEDTYFRFTNVTHDGCTIQWVIAPDSIDHQSLINDVHEGEKECTFSYYHYDDDPSKGVYMIIDDLMFTYLYAVTHTQFEERNRQFEICSEDTIVLVSHRGESYSGDYRTRIVSCDPSIWNGGEDDGYIDYTPINSEFRAADSEAYQAFERFYKDIMKSNYEDIEKIKLPEWIFDGETDQPWYDPNKSVGENYAAMARYETLHLDGIENERDLERMAEFNVFNDFGVLYFEESYDMYEKGDHDGLDFKKVYRVAGVFEPSDEAVQEGLEIDDFWMGFYVIKYETSDLAGYIIIPDAL